MASGHAKVRIDLDRIRRNVQAIASSARVPVYAVIKADAYGLGAATVAEAIADLVEGWAVFSLAEAIEVDLWNRTRKPTVILGPLTSTDCATYLAHHARPAVASPQQAEIMRQADPVLCVDTGMQRFACPAEQVSAALAAGAIREAFTHATALDQVHRLKELVGNRVARLHAAATSLLGQPEAWFDAVRPGLAMYREAVRISLPLVEAHDSVGPVGYSGFTARRHGVILCGYSNGLRKGPCLVNGQPRRIVEVGMQSAYVELRPKDQVGDEVVLLGEDLHLDEITQAWQTSPHEVLVNLARCGEHHFIR